MRCWIKENGKWILYDLKREGSTYEISLSPYVHYTATATEVAKMIDQSLLTLVQPREDSHEKAKS